jgi:WD40 repeat protein
VVSPDGTAVAVTGQSEGATSGQDLATIAYDVSTGAKLWARRYNGPSDGWDGGGSATVSPDGAEVFVTGESRGTSDCDDLFTLAYETTTGATLWSKRYNGPGDSCDGATSIGISPDGENVFVTGESVGAASDFDYATLAYEAATGAKLWGQRYDGPGNLTDEALSLAVSPGGNEVFVTGSSIDGVSGLDYLTIAYAA